MPNRSPAAHQQRMVSPPWRPTDLQVHQELVVSRTQPPVRGLQVELAPAVTQILRREPVHPIRADWVPDLAVTPSPAQRVRRHPQESVRGQWRRQPVRAVEVLRLLHPQLEPPVGVLLPRRHPLDLVEVALRQVRRPRPEAARHRKASFE